jgi:hypothetical protein
MARMADGRAGASVERGAAWRVAADAKDSQLDKRLALFGNGKDSEVASVSQPRHTSAMPPRAGNASKL